MNQHPTDLPASTTELLHSGRSEPTQPNESAGSIAVPDSPEATLQEARSIGNLERSLESVKLAATARKRRREPSPFPTTPHLTTTTAPRRVSAPGYSLHTRSPTKTMRQAAALPADGWVRIISELNIVGSSVEMWLRVDGRSGYIEDFRIGRAPMKP